MSRESVSWSVVRQSLSWSVSLEVISQFNSILLLSCYSLRSAGHGGKKTRQALYSTELPLLLFSLCHTVELVNVIGYEKGDHFALILISRLQHHVNTACCN